MPAASRAAAGFSPILAHFGHWYFQLLYAVPVTVIVAALSIQSWREGRARRAGERGERPAGDRDGDDREAPD